LTFRQRKKKIKFIPAVCKFGDVHPAKLSRLPPNEIEIAPKAQLISKASCHTTPIKSRKLKIQLGELLHKGFIRPNVSLWGALILFIKKKNDRIVRYVSITKSCTSSSPETNTLYLK